MIETWFRAEVFTFDQYKMIKKIKNWQNCPTGMHTIIPFTLDLLWYKINNMASVLDCLDVHLTTMECSFSNLTQWKLEYTQSLIKFVTMNIHNCIDTVHNN